MNNIVTESFRLQRLAYLHAISKKVTDVLLGQQMPCCIDEKLFIEQTGLTSLELVSALSRLRSFGLVDWVFTNGSYYIHKMEVA